MKIFTLILTLFVLLGCDTKSGNDTAQQKISEEQITERLRMLDAERSRLASLRREALDNLGMTTPYYTSASGKIIFNKAEVDPSYIGGEEALSKYLNDNLVYPQEAKEKGLEGTLIMDFVVDEQGKVQEVAVSELPYGDIDQSFRTEAVRVVSAMPDWKPGTQNGAAVAVQYILPITFRLL